jgi:oxygen-independent coproporphyrinogen-3 oxidase
MVDSICKEIERQHDFLNGAKIETVYFGGGTPSVLPPNELNRIFQQLEKTFNIKNATEITLEANPDDLTEDFLNYLKEDSPVNRLSIGVQSFNEEELKFMNRAHNAKEAYECIEKARNYDFEDFSVDLIYASPLGSLKIWEENLNTLIDLEIPHISCYCLTVEEKTALDHQIKKGLSPAPSEKDASEQFLFMQSFFAKHNYIQYEISNIAKEGHFAKHNSNYWKGIPYLGIGPGAHSFNGTDRQWNRSNNALYIKNIEHQIDHFEIERLEEKDRYNEYIMTGLRTIWGVEKAHLKQFDEKYSRYFHEQIKSYLNDGDVNEYKDSFVLKPEAKLRADAIAADLFYI